MRLRLVSCLLGFMIFFSPALSSADTIAELQVQVQALLQQLELMQSGGGGLQPTYSAPSYGLICLNVRMNLGPGSRDVSTGGEVSRLQRFLSQNPRWYPEGDITGYYGPLTVRAVQRFQADRGLISYGDPYTTGFGSVGPRTRVAMFNCNTGNPTPTPTPTPTPQPISHIIVTNPITSITDVPLQDGQAYEARGNGYYIKLLSHNSQAATIEVGEPRCGNPRWPSEPVYTSGGVTCMAIGFTRQLVVNAGQTIEVSVGGSIIRLELTHISTHLVRFTLTPQAAEIVCNLTSSRNDIQPYDSITLSWGSNNATSARWIEGDFSGTVGTQGSVTLNSLAATRTYGIRFENQSSYKDCRVTVRVSSVSNIYINTPVAGQFYRRGTALPIVWVGETATSSARVRLEIYPSSSSRVDGNNDNGIISAGQVSGSYSWTIPAASSSLLADSGIISGLPDGQYRIVAKLYTGDACWGYCVQSPRTILATAQSGVFMIGSHATSTTTSFNVSPLSGGRPLTVFFNTFFTGQPSSPSYYIDYGDGQTQSVTNCPSLNGVCTSPGINTHVYANAGTYTARLVERTSSDATIQSVSITVTSSTN